MKTRVLALVLLCWFLLPGAAQRAVAADWRLSLPGWAYSFPRDHWSHPDFKTEWWYFTGKLTATDGRTFGYQVTFFRQGVRPSSGADPSKSRFAIHSFAFGHAALSDVQTKRFRFSQKLARGAFGEAGFGSFEPKGGKIAWLEGWHVAVDEAGNYSLAADVEGASMHLRFTAVKPWAIHGTGGISQKAEGEGRASHYYSGTRLKTEGTLRAEGRDVAVTGESWFDHEWASNQLTPEQVGWNWFSMQFNDGTELMLYQMRLRNGGLDPYSSGTFVDRDGATTHLTRDDYVAVPIRYWTSPATKARYPIEWRVTVPKLGITLLVSTPLDNQELHLDPIAYWEGLVELRGTRGDTSLEGHGYMELTGYAGALVGLSSQVPSGR